MKTTSTALVLLAALLLPGCYTETAYSREVGAAPQPWYRDGSIVGIREIVHRTEGNPVGGAVAGTVIGGLLGNAFSGGSSAGTFFGAVGGAATGAAASSGSSEQRSYEVTVRFDDGSSGRVTYSTPPAWRTGDRVRQTSHGLEWLGRPAHAPPPQPPPPPVQPPPPPAQAIPPPPPAAPPPPAPPQ